MNSELSKTISTCAVWLAVACILTFGVFQSHAASDFAVMVIFLFAPAIVVFGAVAATQAIWKSRPEDKVRADPAPTLNPTPSPPPVIK